MVLEIVILLLGLVATVSAMFAIYFHLAYQKACRNFLVSSYLLELLDQKKAASIIISAGTFSMFFILAVFRQNLGG